MLSSLLVRLDNASASTAQYKLQAEEMSLDVDRAVEDALDKFGTIVNFGGPLSPCVPGGISILLYNRLLISATVAGEQFCY